MVGDGYRCLRFGDYELDSRSGKLLRDGRPVKIQPQPLRVLTVLTEHQGQLVSREELRERIWGGATFVEFDQGLNYCIRQIRVALRDNASKPQYIETLPKQGYRFIGSIVPNGEIGDSVVQTDEIAAEPGPPTSPAVFVPPMPPERAHKKVLATAAVVLALSAAGIAVGVMRRPETNQPLKYSQITSFTDTAVGPALSRDGRMVAFFRSDRAFFTADQIYVKLLPDGEPVQVTHDPRLKYNLAFSPDGSRIAYTAIDAWDTYTVSSLGGDSRLFLPNASGLNWLDEHRLLFSEIKSGIHMGIVTARDDRSEHRQIYYPAEERGMAHYSYPSPDAKWVLVAEMDPQWRECRLVPFAGGSPGRLAGPRGACTSAAWSPDGAWMYFSVAVGGKRHLWRQRFPDGQPEQITSGPTEEDGIAIAPDGHSLITSISNKQNAIWVHDDRGDRALSTQGYADAQPPWFSSDGKRLYYLLQHGSPESPKELWRSDLNTGNSEAVLPGVSMREYDISNDESEVVFTTQPAGASQLWIAPLNRSAPPRMIGASGEVQPRFGPDGRVLFRVASGNKFYLAKMGRDGSGVTKIFPFPILDFNGISRDRRVAILGIPYRTDSPSRGHDIAFPLDGGPARNLCDGCPVSWSPDGKHLYLEIAPPSQANPAGQTLLISVSPGETLPALPKHGIQSLADGLAIPGARVVHQSKIGPGSGSTYAYVKPTVHANLFRISLRK